MKPPCVPEQGILSLSHDGEGEQKNPISLSKKQGLCIQFIATSNLGLMDHDFYIIFSYIIDFTRWTTELIRTNYGDEIGSRDSSWLIAESSMLIESQFMAHS